MKSIKYLIVILALFSISPAKAQYCVTGLGGAGCSVTDQITGVEIVGTTLSNLNNTCTGTTSNTLTVFPPSGNTTADLIQGVTYTLSITTSANNIISVWIDYDHSQTFDVSEWLQVCTTSIAGGTTTIQIPIPFTSLIGNTGMRIRSRLNGNQNGAADACLSFGSGEAEDYTVNIIPNTPCSGAPTAGTTAANDSSVCPNHPFTLTLAGSTLASGLTYQWESSPNNIAWSPIAGATNISLQTTQTSDTYYHCIVTCAGQSATSTSLLITTNTFINCYCNSTATSTASPDIGNVTLGALTNGSATPTTNNAAAINMYTDYTSLPASVFLQGVNYPISISQINQFTTETQSRIAVFIDYDHSGTYDTLTEKVFTGITNITPSTNTISGTVSIPLSSTAGLTGMRVVLIGSTFTILDACGTYYSGETEDYIVNIQAATPCVAPPTAGTAISSVSSVCPNINFNLNLTGTSIASGLSFQWESSPNGITWTPIAGATSINYTTSLTSTTYYHCIVTCSGVPDTSSPVMVTMNTFLTCYCTSGATSTGDDDIGNVTFGSINNGIATPATLNPTSTNTYSDFTTLPVQTFLQGLNYPIEVTQIDLNGFYVCSINVFVDFNHDGIFDPSTESIFTGVTTAGTGGNTVSGNVTIPLTSLPGNTVMRVILVEGGFATINPCGTYTWGETEDYMINIQAATPCTTPPAAGAAISSSPSVCPNIPFNLNLQGSAIASGLSYQWQDSPNGTSWTNIAGATSINYQTTLTTTTYYQCIVTCSGVSSTSTPVMITVNSFVSCYCTSGATSTGDDDIGNVTFGLLNNGIATPSTQNPTSVNTYSDFTNLPPFSYIQTLSYPISVTQINLNGYYVCHVVAYIDYDHDGTFDPSTEVVIDSVTYSGHPYISGNVVIPPTSQYGITRMRVVLVEGGASTAAPCGTYTWGETEDYLVNILAPISCSLPFNAGLAKSSYSAVCASDVFTLSIDSLPPDTGFTFQWQQSFDNIAWTNIAGATLQIYNGSQNFDSYYRCNVTCNAGTTMSTTPVQILSKPVSQCDYCNTGISGNCSTNYYLDSVAIGGTSFNNSNTGCAANAGFAYSKYPINGNTTTDLARGNYYDLFVKTAGSCNLSVWIDYDQSGTFDANEWIQVSQATDTIIASTVPLVLPLTAKLGTTGLRVRSRKAGNLNLSADACSAYGSGETEDYYVTIVDAISTGKELANDKNIKIYPNPTTGIVSVEYRSDESKTLQVKLMNTDGQILFAENSDKFKGTYLHKVDLSSFSKGIYFIQFVTDSNVVTKKIVLN